MASSSIPNAPYPPMRSSYFPSGGTSNTIHTPRHHPQPPGTVNKPPPPKPAIQFYNESTLSCINCRNDNNAGGGPLLLELRTLDFEPTEESLFRTTTHYESRGNPSLGTSVSSTCLDIQDQACITGLSTGSLCIHNVQNKLLEYKTIPRLHRPSTCVQWRPQTSQMALALGNANKKSSNNNTKRMGVVSNPSGRPGHHPGDRDYCCFVFDVAQTLPLYKLSHLNGIASLQWILESTHTLVLGSQHRNLQLYDLRSNASPWTVYAHNFSVDGICVDPHTPHLFGTYSHSSAEPVKLWDVRRMEQSPMAEIKLSGGNATVTKAQFCPHENGRLVVLAGNAMHEYDTTLSRPSLLNSVYTHEEITDFALYPFPKSNSNQLYADMLSKRMMIVNKAGSVLDTAMHRIAPVTISHRTGQTIGAFGENLLVGSNTNTPAAMESPTIDTEEDISATMMRRARCLHVAKYSMDTASNVKMLRSEASQLPEIDMNRIRLLRVWRWVQRVERMCLDYSNGSGSWYDGGTGSAPNGAFAAKGLVDAGPMRLLLESPNEDTEEHAESLLCTTYDSAGRRAALISCGWVGKFDLEQVMEECEQVGEYERSAALAVWHGDMGAAVDALQRGSDAYTEKHEKYAESLGLVALSIAGYRGGSENDHVWRRACGTLLNRIERTEDVGHSGGVAYLQRSLKFLLALGVDNQHKDVLDDEGLSLCDRVALACRFLPKAELAGFLENRVSQCLDTGNIEGLSLTGFDRTGFQIIQSYVDETTDVQSAALLSCRVILPQEWNDERRKSTEWLHVYRGLLNRWQMWQSRALFDVDRAELLRRLKARPNDTHQAGSGKGLARPRVQAPLQAQIDARCNYCSSPLGLRRQDRQSSTWLSKMKNVLSCCPRCRKPLPRCAICLLSLGALNPYIELRKQPSAGSDNTSLANLPFAEWFTWCVRCKHGGHAHHLVGWFSKHKVCPVSGCDCNCQFDGIEKLKRPAMWQPSIEEESTKQGPTLMSTTPKLD